MKIICTAFIGVLLLVSFAFSATVSYTTNTTEDAIIRWLAAQNGITAAQQAQQSITSCLASTRSVWVRQQKDNAQEAQRLCLDQGKNFSTVLDVTTGVIQPVCQ